jgi:hypothetical protein
MVAQGIAVYCCCGFKRRCTMVGAKTMTGIEGHTITALPHDQLRQVLKEYNR